ncbi:MAG: hypothetical protein LAT68_00600 [Cyclobacteriaceae bacterium]|nr:hypothetical protein [Cyclobacteriaceae bacterium]MCH8514802.1 hypothetical protein [Cyclobacteriaceae bacterium]
MQNQNFGYPRIDSPPELTKSDRLFRIGKPQKVLEKEKSRSTLDTYFTKSRDHHKEDLNIMPLDLKKWFFTSSIFLISESQKDPSLEIFKLSYWNRVMKGTNKTLVVKPLPLIVSSFKSTRRERGKPKLL